MRVYLAKDLSNLPMYGNVPDLSQKIDVVDSFDISEEEGTLIDELFVDPTNELCEAALDNGDYQYYNAYQCKLLLEWVSKISNEAEMIPISSFLDKLEAYLQYAVAYNTGIAIEL